MGANYARGLYKEYEIVLSEKEKLEPGISIFTHQVPADAKGGSAS